VQRVVLASSGAVYGEQPEQPLREDMNPIPDSPYAVSKLSAEIYVRTLGALWGIETVALRIFNAYGPGQQLPASHAPVIPRLLKAALTGASLVIFGDGSNRRDFVYVDDVVEGLAAAASAPNIDRQVINVGSGVETSLDDLVKAIQQVTGREAEPLRNPGQQAGLRHMKADITRAGQLLGFAPRTALLDGLRLTLERDPRFAATTNVG
jgi:UDP-glucose 4-epimerase